MGIKGLRTYMTRKNIQPPIREKISIRDEINKWKTQHDGKRPKLLIDLRAISHMVIQARQPEYCVGGQYNLYINYYRSLFRSLNFAGADLVFFAPGGSLSDRLDIFIPAQEAKYIAHVNVLDDFEATEGKWSKSVEPKSKKRAPVTVSFNMLRLAKQFGQVHHNYVRYSQEIAKYAIANDEHILAVITNNTEFMAFDEGKYQVWRATDIIRKGLTAFRFCRHTLRGHLDLNTEQLRLLSALAGTDYLPRDVLEEFYKKIGIDSCTDGKHIPALAKYIRAEVQLLPVPADGMFCVDLKKVAVDIFGEQYSVIDLNCIANGLTQYNLNFIVDGKYPFKRASLDFCKTYNMFIFKLYTDQVFLVRDISFIDYRHVRSKNYAQLTIPLLRKMQGVLYANEKNRPRTRSFCMKYAHDEPFKMVDEMVLYPPMKIPELFDLVFKTKEAAFDSIRWSLIDWIFGFDVTFRVALQKVPKAFCAVILTIKYLLMKREITEVEADAFMMTEYFTRKEATAEDADLRAPVVLNTHFIRLAHLYTKICCLINHCLEVCGLYSHTALIMFDGPYFHFALDNLVTGKDDMSEELAKIKNLRIYVD